MARIDVCFAGTHLRNISSRPLVSRGVGGSARIRFRASRPLQLCQPGQLTGRELEERLHPVVDIRALGRGRPFLPGDQLRNVGLADLCGDGQVSLLGSHCLEPMAEEQRKTHERTSMIN